MDTPFYGKFVSKNQNCLLKLQFGTQTNFDCVKLDGDVVFFCFRPFLQVLSKKPIWRFDVT